MKGHEPSYRTEDVRRLASDPETFDMDPWAIDDALGYGLDDEDVRELFDSIDAWNFIKTMPTRKHHPNTMSDVYVYFVDLCLTRIYIKFVIDGGILTVTSFKEDENNDYT